MRPLKASGWMDVTLFSSRVLSWPSPKNAFSLNVTVAAPSGYPESIIRYWSFGMFWKVLGAISNWPLFVISSD